MNLESSEEDVEGGRTWETLSSKASTAVMPERTELMGLLKERRR
jgi:hypothetical protein